MLLIFVENNARVLLWCLFTDGWQKRKVYVFCTCLLMAKSDSLCSLRPYSSFAIGKFHIIFEGIRTGHLH